VGTTFKIYLPATEGIPEPLTENPSSQFSGRGNETILLVDDRDDLRNVLGEMLSRRGYSLLLAENGEETMKTFQDHKGKIDILITDALMPDVYGDELAREIRKKSPQLPLILISANLEPNRSGVENVHFLRKPFTFKALMEKIQLAVAQ
jgi:CheY-like chemotaxis protein